MDGPVPSSMFKVQRWEAGSQGAALALFPDPQSAIRNYFAAFRARTAAPVMPAWSPSLVATTSTPLAVPGMA